jgi:hypothetical protein
MSMKMNRLSLSAILVVAAAIGIGVGVASGQQSAPQTSGSAAASPRSAAALHSGKKSARHAAKSRAARQAPIDVRSAFASLQTAAVDDSDAGALAQTMVKHMNGKSTAPFHLASTPYGDVFATLGDGEVCLVVTTAAARVAGCAPAQDATNPKTPLMTTISDAGKLSFFALTANGAQAPKVVAADGAKVSAAASGSLVYGQTTQDARALELTVGGEPASVAFGH